MTNKTKGLAAASVLCALAACSPALPSRGNIASPVELSFGPERQLGNTQNNPSTPFLRYAPAGRSEQEAGVYYSVSKDDGKSFAARGLVQANTAPEILYNNLVAGEMIRCIWRGPISTVPGERGFS